jgi:protein-disulfide isomerase
MQRSWIRLVLLLSAIVLWLSAIPSAQASSFWENQVLHVIHDHPEAVVEALTEFDKRSVERQHAQQQQFLKSLKSQLPEILEESPQIGSVNPSVYLIEFSDFQCPFCREVQAELLHILNRHPNVALAYKNLPLPTIHSEAVSAAKAAWAAHLQNQFWQFHDALFSFQDDLSPDSYKKIAKELKLDLRRFEQDQQSDETYSAVKRDIALANELGIQGTPFFVVTNGNDVQTVSGANLAGLESAISQLTDDRSSALYQVK